MKRIEKTLLTIFAPILFFALLYTLWGFIHADFNMMNWGIGERGFMAFVWFVLSAFFTGLIISEVKVKS